MMDFTTLDKLKNALRPVTWKKIHWALARYAVGENKITGDRLMPDSCPNAEFPRLPALANCCEIDENALQSTATS